MVLTNQVRLFLQVVSRGLAFIWAISTVENSESCRATRGQRGPSHHHPPEGLGVMGNVPAAQSGDSNDRDSPAGDSKAMGNVPAALGTAQSGEHPGVGTALSLLPQPAQLSTSQGCSLAMALPGHSDHGHSDHRHSDHGQSSWQCHPPLLSVAPGSHATSRDNRQGTALLLTHSAKPKLLQ